MTFDVAQLVEQGWPFVGAAVGAYGTAVLTRTADEGATATVSLGQRVLQRLWHREESRPYLQRAVQGVADDPEDTEAQAGLRAEIRRLLREDDELARDLAELLPAPVRPNESYVASGQGAVTARVNHGVISTGGDVTVER
ncbi:hypothetical protein ABZX72_17045 [Streptomyces cyaneofuscatus]|uniref:hypothetical protein n=1 Tax=Streptomyces cyaneofuscatus TaxID=66883 RepID=UPI0033BDFF21